MPVDPIPNDPSRPRIKGVPDFALQPERFDNKQEQARENDFEQEELIIDQADMPRRIKGFVDMERQTEDRWKPVRHEDPFYEDQPINELTNDVLAALDKGTKPEKNAPNFKRYDAAGKNQDLKTVMEVEEKKTKAQTENKQKSKEAYQVKNNFQSTEAQRKKARAAKQKKTAKPAMFKNADEEVNAYMAELGLL